MPAQPMPQKLNIFFAELGVGLDAYYNPKQITIDKGVAWAEHKGALGDSPSFEFTNMKPRTMKLELFFDTYETGESVQEKYIRRLELGSSPCEDAIGQFYHPPTCVISWGSGPTGFDKFVGVIESMSINYTMFFKTGAACRATATLTLKEPDLRNRIAQRHKLEASSSFDREANFQFYTRMLSQNRKNRDTKVRANRPLFD